MGSKSNNRRRKPLLQRILGARHKAWNALLGRNRKRKISGQTDPEIIYMVFDQETEMFLEVQPYCHCGDVFFANGFGSAYCQHCDRLCEDKECIPCLALGRNFNAGI